MKFIKAAGIYVPDEEQHLLLPNKKGKPFWDRYQYDRLEAAIPHAKHLDVAVDVGAHVGLITRRLAATFREVHAFEPSPVAYECLVANTSHLKNVRTYNVAVGDVAGEIGIEDVVNNTGNRQVIPSGTGTRIVTLDEALPALWCDLIKIDVQGYELRVLKGAQRVLAAYSPVLIVEVEPDGKLTKQFDPGEKTLAWLKKQGAETVSVLDADHVMKFGDDGARPYRKYAAHGDYHWGMYANSKGFKAGADLVVDIVNNNRHASVLDVGCGDGVYAARIANCVGVDNNLTAVKWARKHNVRADHMSAYRIKDLGKFDAVILFDALEHLPFPGRFLAEVLPAVTSQVYILNPGVNHSKWHWTEFEHSDMEAFALANGGWRLKSRTDVPDTGKVFFHFARD